MGFGGDNTTSLTEDGHVKEAIVLELKANPDRVA